MRFKGVIVKAVLVWLSMPVSTLVAQHAVGIPTLKKSTAVEQSEKKEGATPAAQPADPLQFGDPNTLWGRPTLQYRLRPEFRNNADLDKDSSDDTLIGFQRARVGLKLNYSNWFETLVQVQDARTFGYMNTSVAYGGNTDLHQAFVKFKMFGDRFSLKIGRQQLVYGDQRLIGNLEWANVPRVFDAVVFRVNHRWGFTDAFVSLFSSDPLGNLSNFATAFTGVYNEMSFLNRAIVWDLYVLGLFDGEFSRAPGTMYDPIDVANGNPGRRFATAGTRLRYSGKTVSAGIEGAYQFGLRDYEAEVAQNAFALHGDVKATIGIPTKPWVKIGGNFATGEDTDGETATRFINLFPTNHLFYGFMDLAGWSNALNLNFQAGFVPTNRVTVFVDYWMLARASVDDGWVNAGGKLLLPPPDPTAPTDYDGDRLLGHEIDVTVKIPIIRQISTMGGVSFFAPAGYALAKGDDPQIWAYLMLAVAI